MTPEENREVAKKVFLSCYMDTPFDPPDHVGAIEKIALALLLARREALTEAAKVADGFSGHTPPCPLHLCSSCKHGRAIRDAIMFLTLPTKEKP